MLKREDMDRWLSLNYPQDFHYRFIAFVLGDSEDESASSLQAMSDMFSISHTISANYGKGWLIGTVNIPLHLNMQGWMVYAYQEKAPVTAKTHKE